MKKEKNNICRAESLLLSTSATLKSNEILSKDFSGRHEGTRGFTLIELLVVVLIIGILAAVAVPQYQKAVMKSRMAQLTTALHSIVQAEQLYFLANGTYTNDRSKLDIEFAGSDEAYPTDSYLLKIQNGSCGINAVYDKRPGVYCKLTDSVPSIYLGYFLTSHNTMCCNYTPTNELGNQICRQETGFSTPSEDREKRKCYGSY